ncbi:hypothetical protein TNCV_3156181 [Trichonephila clavipes]|nr:hypothetical protein TNCV_3156181 [Trichonephila clavipes]
MSSYCSTVHAQSSNMEHKRTKNKNSIRMFFLAPSATTKKNVNKEVRSKEIKRPFPSTAMCDEAHFWLNGYVNKQNCRIWSEANPQVYVETPLHPEKLTVWCALWAGGILLQKR